MTQETEARQAGSLVDALDLASVDMGDWSYFVPLTAAKEIAAPYERELVRLRADIAEASGELLIPIPAPGSESAKLLSANVLLKQEIVRLRARVAELEAANTLRSSMWRDFSGDNE